MARALHQSVPQTLTPEISSVNPFLARAITVQRKIEDGSSLDEFDAEVIDLALRRLIREGRVPFQRFRDHIMLGTERWKTLEGLDYYRTILMHRKSDVWYPESEMSQLSVFSVYASSQVQPPDPNVFDRDRGRLEEYTYDLLDRAHIGPSIDSSYQKILEEAPPDWRIDAIGTVQENLREYVKELSRIDSELAVDLRDELESFLRKLVKKKTDKIADGELVAVMEAYLNAQSYQGKPRAIPGPKQMVGDKVRKSCEYVRKQMFDSENPMTRAIAQHLKDFVKIGQTCEYKGDWKWRF